MMFKAILDAAKAIDTGKLLAKSFVTVILAVTIGMIVSEALSENAQPPPPAISTGPTPENPNEVVNFILFHAVPYKHLRITTGLMYPDAHATEPDHQYCYAARALDGVETTLRLDLAGTDRTGSVIYKSIDDADAQAFGLGAAELEAVAKEFCRFLGDDRSVNDGSTAVPSGRPPRENGDEL